MTKQTTSDLFRAYIDLDNGETLAWPGLTYNQARWRYHWIQRELVRSLTGPRWKTYGYELEGKA
jgi:hypothetical protein